MRKPGRILSKFNVFSMLLLLLLLMMLPASGQEGWMIFESLTEPVYT